MASHPPTHPIAKAAAVVFVLLAAGAGVWAGSLGRAPRPRPVAAADNRPPELLSAADAPLPGDSVAERGGELFEQRCARCHTVGGGDRKGGPDLAQAALRRDLGWVRAMVAAPDSMFRTDSAAQSLLEVHGIDPMQIGTDDPDLRALGAYFARFDLGALKPPL